MRIVAVTGFEPILPDPESDVLPLHHTAIQKARTTEIMRANINLMFNLDTSHIFDCFNFTTILPVLMLSHCQTFALLSTSVNTSHWYPLDS